MFLKSLLLGLKKKIGEPIMIILTVAIAVATFVSALTLRGSIEQSAVASYRALSGEAELEATLEDENVYFLTEDNDAYRALQAAVEPYGELYGGYLFYASIGKEEESFAEVYATDLDTLTRYNSFSILSGEIRKSRTGVILSERFASEIGAETGDFLTATRYGSSQRILLEVTAVAKGEGLFAETDALLAEETASRLSSLGDSVKVYNRFFIDLSDEKMDNAGVDAALAAEAIQAAAPRFVVTSPVNDRNVQVTLSYQSTLLFIIAVIVAVLGAILIYTAVTLVMKNRVSVASLFKSVGASNGELTLYLLGEILLYGVVGSLIGIAGSLGVSAIFRAITGSIVSIAVGWLPALMGVLFGIVLALLSALIPVLRLSLSPLYDMLHSHTPILSPKPLPLVVTGGLCLLFFLWSAFAGVAYALLLGVFAFLTLIAFLFTLVPFAIKGVSHLLCRVTEDRPLVGKLRLAAVGAKNNRHAHSGARLLAIAVMAVVSVAVLLGEAKTQLNTFGDLFRADVMISADREELTDIALETSAEEGVSGAYLAYIETRCALEGAEGNTVSLFAVRGQDYEKAFRTDRFGLDPTVLKRGKKAVISGGLALKLGIEPGDTFVMTVDGVQAEFELAAVIDTPLTLVFTDLSALGGKANVCLVDCTTEAYQNLTEKYAIKGAVYHATDAFDYVIDLASAYFKVFTIFEILVFVFAAIGYLNNAIASYRDRRREYELLVAAGASKGDQLKIVLFENIIVVAVAAILGAAFSFALLFVVQNMLKSLGLYFTLLG